MKRKDVEELTSRFDGSYNPMAGLASDGGDVAGKRRPVSQVSDDNTSASQIASDAQATLTAEQK